MGGRRGALEDMDLNEGRARMTQPPPPGLDPAFWRGRRVLLTGHTGFKGAWAALWLDRLGAAVSGLALAPEGEPNLYGMIGGDGLACSHIADLRDAGAVARVVAQAAPEIVIHMAAQSLVRRSVAEPVATVATNVMGTAHLLQALRDRPGLRAVLVVTSDKVYANDGGGRRFAEGDSLGGKDPYAASKAATEIIVRAFAETYLAAAGVAVATVRGGNVIGGGDFCADRIVPDCVRAASAGHPLVLRHPEAVRPWQHVLDCLAGYFACAEALAVGRSVPPALNIGPPDEPPVTVAALVERFLAALGRTVDVRHEPVAGSIEALALRLDAGAAMRTLGWRPRLDTAAAIAETAGWYRAFLDGADMRATTLAQIAAYEARAPEAAS